MVIPILEYASIVWGDKNNKVLMDSIQVLQNKAAKLVLDRVAHSSSTQALLDLNWMNLSARRLMQRCFFMHNFTNDSERNSMITRDSDYHSYNNTRSKETIRFIRSNTNWALLRSLIVYWQTGIPFLKTWDVYLKMLLKFHYLKILNLNTLA